MVLVLLFPQSIRIACQFQGLLLSELRSTSVEYVELLVAGRNKKIGQETIKAHAQIKNRIRSGVNTNCNAVTTTNNNY